MVLFFINQSKETKNSIHIYLYFKTSESITECFKLYRMEAKYFKLERWAKTVKLTIRNRLVENKFIFFIAKCCLLESNYVFLMSHLLSMPLGKELCLQLY